MIQITGKVIHGDNYGKILGFPTANLDRREYNRKKMNVRFGVWGGEAFVSLKAHKAAIVIGPIDGMGLPKIEAHLIGFHGNLYGKKISIALKKFIRPFKKFKNIEALKKQITLDINTIKK